MIPRADDRHAAAEEAVLYSAVERVLRARGGAVSTMTLAHEEIPRLTETLDPGEQASNHV